MDWQGSKPKSGKSKVNYHPWRRFYARSIDLFLASFMVAGFCLSALGLFAPSLVAGAVDTFKNPLISGVIVYVFWVPLEALFLSRVGATPGKRLFGIQVLTKSGDTLSFPDALQRTFLVWIKGDGLAIPIIAIVTRIYAYKRLKRTGATLWDEAMGSVVTHREFTLSRTIACVLVLVAIAVITLFLSFAGKI